MVRRPSHALTALALLVLAVVAGGVRPAASQGRSPVALATAPHSARSDLTVSITWIFRAADVVACETPAPDLRRLQREYGDRMQLTVYFMGADTALARSFLRKERLGGIRLEQISEARFRQEFARGGANAAMAPLVVLSAPERSPLFLFADVRMPEGRRDVDRLGGELRSLLSRTPMSGDMVLSSLSFHGGRQ